MLPTVSLVVEVAIEYETFFRELQKGENSDRRGEGIMALTWTLYAMQLKHGGAGGVLGGRRRRLLRLICYTPLNYDLINFTK